MSEMTADDRHHVRRGAGPCGRVHCPVHPVAAVAGMTRPLLLDLFCGAGGAAKGYHDAGFDENVVGAGSVMGATLALHGGMFGLGVHRPRLFRSNVLILAPAAPIKRKPIGVYDRGPRKVTHFRTRLNGNGKGRSEMRIARTLEEAQQVMGMEWGDWHGVKEAIPPAYTRLIGEQLMAAIAVVA